MPQKLSLPPAVVSAARASVRRANAAVQHLLPGDPVGRQPVHTVYGGAHLFKSDTARKLGDLALRSLETNAPDAAALARALNVSDEARLYRTVYSRLVEKLRREPVEDLRVDFEDGYGIRSDEEEDGHALSCAQEFARGFAEGTLPPFVGLRIKSLSNELFDRAIRTLDLFVTAAVKATGGKLPPHFIVTIPKVTVPAQVAMACRLLTALEKRLKLRAGTIRMELMVETPLALIGTDGAVALPRIVRAGSGRVSAVHFGTYDYTASLNVTATHQRMDHPACDFARQLMQVSLAGSGVWLSDGATNVMPVGPHRAGKDEALTHGQLEENQDVVHAAWRTSFRNIRQSLTLGIYQGWDLHPAQLPVRYAAVYAFFLEALPAASERLSAFVDKAARATLVGHTFDDAATGQGLLNFFVRGIACGALSEGDVAATGLSVEEIRTRSFLQILEGREKLKRR